MSAKKKNEMRIILKAFDKFAINEAVNTLLLTAKKTGALVHGPIPFPTNNKYFTVIRSPHVDKESREKFKISFMKVLVVIIPTKNTIDALKNISISSRVDIKISLNN